MVRVHGHTGALHAQHGIKNQNEPFVDIVCSSIPITLLEAELFAHKTDVVVYI